MTFIPFMLSLDGELRFHLVDSTYNYYQGEVCRRAFHSRGVEAHVNLLQRYI